MGQRKKKSKKKQKGIDVVNVFLTVLRVVTALKQILLHLSPETIETIKTWIESFFFN
jgi:hypothetical protein